MAQNYIYKNKLQLLCIFEKEKHFSCGSAACIKQFSMHVYKCINNI